MNKLALRLAIVASAAGMFVEPAIAQNTANTDTKPAGDWMDRLESAIFDTPSTGKNGDGAIGSGDTENSADVNDVPAAPQSDDDADFKNGRADLTGETAGDAPSPDAASADAPDKYVPDAGDPEN